MPTQMTLEQFGKSVKAKYPQYDSVPDVELANKIIAKYPQYKSVIAAPSSTPTPPEDTRNGFQKTVDGWFERGGPTAENTNPQRGYLSDVWNVASRAGENVAGMVAHPVQAAEGTADILNEVTNMEDPNFHGPITRRIKEFRDEYAKDPRLAVDNLAGDIAGMYASGKLMTGAGDVAKGTVALIADRVGNIGRSAAQILTKTTPEDTAEWAKETGKKQAAAEHETQGRELTHKQAVNTEAESISGKESLEAQKLKAAHEKELKEVQEHNQRVREKHAAVSKRIQEENRAQEETLRIRQEKQSALDKETSDYYAKEDAAKSKAKEEENAAWQPWRTKMKGATIDGAEIVAPLKKIASMSPEVMRTLRQLQPTAEDAPPDSLYAQDRTQIMKSQGYTGSYFDYPADVRSRIDSIAASSGFEPEPIDFDPEAGKQIPVEQVHRANSILQQYIRSGRFEGPLLGEMKQVAKVLRASVSRASLEHGAAADLDSARQATITYNDAFGRERHLPTTQDEIREKQANPEAYREREDEDRLSKAKKYDPQLVESYRSVKSAREALKKLPVEDQLRKGQKQVPPPPTVNDLREGYRLKAEPKAPSLRLTSGSPGERATQTVSPPEKVDTSKIGTTDLHEHNLENVSKRAEGIREYGAHRVGWSLGLGLSTGLATAIFGHPILGIFDGITAAFGGLYGSYAVERMLTSGPVAEWIAHPTAEQWAQIEKLPLEQKAKFRAGMEPIVKAARERKMQVSPRLLAFTGGATANIAGPQMTKLKQARDHARFSHVAVGPNGHRIGSNDGQTWVDTETGEPVNAQ